IRKSAVELRGITPEKRNKKHQLKLGNGIIIPANKSHCFNAKEKFKMISTVIKSGYDDEAPAQPL
ncbi:MAG: hypothetical protein ABI855_04055, partial [Bacteroidota bacterium]